jgi:hypothetical protein
VNDLLKVGTAVLQEWERCRDAARIAEQGAELGATADNKVSSLLTLLGHKDIGFLRYPLALFDTLSRYLRTYRKKLVINYGSLIAALVY